MKQSPPVQRFACTARRNNNEEEESKPAQLEYNPSSNLLTLHISQEEEQQHPISQPLKATIKLQPGQQLEFDSGWVCEIHHQVQDQYNEERSLISQVWDIAIV